MLSIYFLGLPTTRQHGLVMPDHTIRHRDGAIVSQGAFNALMAEHDRLSKYRSALRQVAAWHDMDHDTTSAVTIQKEYDAMIEAVRSALTA